jgi:hypothetical protein
MEQMEAIPILHTQEVRGSSPCAPTNFHKYLRVSSNPHRRRVLAQSTCFTGVDPDGSTHNQCFSCSRNETFNEAATDQSRNFGSRSVASAVLSGLQ